MVLNVTVVGKAFRTVAAALTNAHKVALCRALTTTRQLSPNQATRCSCIASLVFVIRCNGVTELTYKVNKHCAVMLYDAVAQRSDRLAAIPKHGQFYSLHVALVI